MNPLRLEIHPRAAVEAGAARRWYAQRSPATAQRFVAELDRAIQRITAAPQQFPPYLHGTRVYRIPRFPYLIVYLEASGLVQVLAVAHGKRRPGYWRRRLP
jgi:plasmid stabilization system protein ParE